MHKSSVSDALHAGRRCSLLTLGILAVLTASDLVARSVFLSSLCAKAVAPNDTSAKCPSAAAVRKWLPLPACSIRVMEATILRPCWGA